MTEIKKAVDIRLYKPEDFETINQWWAAANETPPPPELIPDTTFILTYDGEAVLALSVLLTNSKIAVLENFISNPKWAGSVQRHAMQSLVDYACCFAANLGYSRVVCLAYHDKLKACFQELGLTQTLDGVATFARNLTDIQASKGMN